MARIRSKTSVVCDAGPIIHLDELDCLYLMQDFEKVFVPTVVRKEVLMHRSAAFENANIRWEEIPDQSPVEEHYQTVFKVFSLDAREVAALSFMSKKPGLMFLTDDAAARLVATKLGYDVHGTTSILIRAIRRDLMEPEKVIDTLKNISLKTTLYIKSSLLNEVISLVEREFEH